MYEHKNTETNFKQKSQNVLQTLLICQTKTNRDKTYREFKNHIYVINYSQHTLNLYNKLTLKARCSFSQLYQDLSKTRVKMS